MSGHSKWANIKHRKAASDSKRAQIFTKIAKDIVIAARRGTDPNGNSALRLVLDKARRANMPNKNIERAIKRGSGEDGEADYMEILYEAYAPHGIGIILEVVTDNKNRAVAELRHALSRNGGSLASDGAVSWQFTRKGVITLSADAVPDEDEFFMLVAEAGADDVEFGDSVTVYCPIESFQAVQEAILAAKIEFEEANLIYDPKSTTVLGNEETIQVMKMLEKLEDLEDIQNVYSTLEITEEAMAEMDQ